MRLVEKALVGSLGGPSRVESLERFTEIVDGLCQMIGCDETSWES